MAHFVGPTSVAVGVISGVRAGEAGLAWVDINGVNPNSSSTAVLSWGVDRIPDTAVRQPTRVAAVHALVPGSVHLSSGGQCGILPPAIRFGLVVREARQSAGMEDLT